MRTETIFEIRTNADFEKAAIEMFNFQYLHNIIYQRFCNLLGVPKSSVKTIKDIPYLPIEFFRTEKVVSSQNPTETVFTSSGTTGSTPSAHYVTDLSLYEKSFTNTIHQFYGSITEYTIIALLPSYLERQGSSLIHMVDYLIKKSTSHDSGFYLDQTNDLIEILQKLTSENKKIMLIGVSFALLDIVENHQLQLGPNTIVIETGGMKGRRKEIIREELHQKLKQGLGVSQIHSEYGMTELLSQAYALADGLFRCPPWMKVTARNTEESLALIEHGKTGGINIIDLANLNSCSFIATQDLGKTYKDGSFEVLGRFDNSDVRGCNLMLL